MKTGTRQRSSRRYTPALEKALSFLEKQARIGTGLSIQNMAHQADVSYVTMWKAVRHGKSGSRVSVDAREPRGSSRIMQGPPGPRSQKQPVWERLKARLEEEMLQGRLPHVGAFPHVKELQIRYGAGSREIVKALRALSDAGVLRHAGRRYFPNNIVPASHSDLKIRLLVCEWSAQGLLSDYDKAFVPRLELECASRHIGMELAFYRPQSGLLQVTTRQHSEEQPVKQRSDITGYVLLIYSPACLHDGLFAQLHATGKPLVIVDEIGGWEVPLYLAHSKSFLFVHARPCAAAALSRSAGLLICFSRVRARSSRISLPGRASRWR